MNYKENSFDVIRHAASVLIMISHYIVFLVGLENISFSRWLFAGPSLVAFFMICGFFLIPSLSRTNSLVYIVKRILRIYPLYMISVLLTIVFAFIVSQFSPGGGYVHPNPKEMLEYILKMIIKPNAYVINGVSNGAIWAIFIEFQIYILAAIFRKILLNNQSKKFWFLILFVFFVINLCSKTLIKLFINQGMNTLANIYSSSALPYMYFFVIGIIAFKFFNEYIPSLKRSAYVILVVFLIWHTWLKYNFSDYLEVGFYTDPITVILTSLTVLGLSYSMGNIRFKTDLSYGIFVWHMPVVTFFAANKPTGTWDLIILCIFVTLILAVVSQKIVSRFIPNIQTRIISYLQKLSWQVR